MSCRRLRPLVNRPVQPVSNLHCHGPNGIVIQGSGERRRRRKRRLRTSEQDQRLIADNRRRNQQPIDPITQLLEHRGRPRPARALRSLRKRRRSTMLHSPIPRAGTTQQVQQLQRTRRPPPSQHPLRRQSDPSLRLEHLCKTGDVVWRHVGHTRGRGRTQRPTLRIPPHGPNRPSPPQLIPRRRMPTSDRMDPPQRLRPLVNRLSRQRQRNPRRFRVLRKNRDHS